MSLGTTNAYLPVWPLGAGKAGLGTCLCGGGGDIFYDILAIGGGHGGDDASLTRDFALPPKVVFLVGEFTAMRDRRWNDNTGAPAWVTTPVATKRIAKVYLRDTGQGCAHPQVDMKFAESAGFLDPARRICRNWQPVGTGGNPPCEVFVFSGIGFSGPPAPLRWSVASRVIGGTTYGAEAVSGPAHKLGIGGTDWKGEDDFLAGWTSFRYPGYGTPGMGYSVQCTRESFVAGRRGSNRELWFMDGFGKAGVNLHLYDAAGVVNWSVDAVNSVYTVKPLAVEDHWVAGGAGLLFSFEFQGEITAAETGALSFGTPYMVAVWPGGLGGGSSTTDLLPYPTAMNAGPGYVAGEVVGVRFAGPGTFDWNAAGAADLVGGVNLDSSGAASVGQSWNQTLSGVGGTTLFDCDADGRIYFGLNVLELGGVAVPNFQLFRANRLGGNRTQIGTFGKAGVEGYVFGCVVVNDPAYGGAGISHAIVVGDFDTYTPPAGASSTAVISGLNGIAVLSLRDGQEIAAQTFWPGRFQAGVVTVNTGDWLPGIVAEV